MKTIEKENIFAIAPIRVRGFYLVSIRKRPFRPIAVLLSRREKKGLAETPERSRSFTESRSATKL